MANVNILVDRLPTTVWVDGVEYSINPDFRACLRTILAFEDQELTTYEKQSIMLQNFYGKVIPPNVETAAKEAVKFLDGPISKGQKEQAETSNVGRLYSFKQDANLIFNAFKQTHGIDLEQTETMHWWKFLVLFFDLGAETSFTELISLRRRIKTGKATKYEREAAREMGSMFHLEDCTSMSLEELEKSRIFMDALAAGE